MKVKRMLTIDKEVLERLNAVCSKHEFYRNSFVVHAIQENLEYMNDIPDFEVDRIRLKEKKDRMQIYIDDELYSKIKNKKSRRIERLIEKIMVEGGYEIETK